MQLTYPFTGRWLVQNSPADRVPSHRTHLFATTYSIDFVPVDARGRSAPLRLASLLVPEPPQRFTGFGRPVLAPAPGTVLAAHDGEEDHDAQRGLPSVAYAVTQRRRLRGGWAGLAGNHVVIEVAPGVLVALCHLRRGTVAVTPGQHVDVGALLGGCGNSGNSTEPHLHVQAFDGMDVATATGLPVAFDGALPRNGHIVELP
ncbi:M23 family metallopeptidase [Nocardioides sp. Soil805]|uniref:M23 family metallopeptidase n=1 Tax=Nocardioides sp. Soil805 TaxID=1736416 RepID=UPI001F1B0970|nr:M23 family metallopeptidase [Nocardioides sp. Soil805]